MAEAILVIALQNLNSLVQNEVGLFVGFDQEMKRLSSKLTSMKSTLEDAEERQLKEGAIKDWLQKLKDAAHMLDDILDECATEALELEYEGLQCGQADKGQGSCLSSFHPKHVVFRHKIAKKMKRIRERLDEIAEERSQFHLREMVTERRTEVIDWRQTTSIITQPQLYGREEDTDKIVNFLVADATDFEDLSVYPILGMGGLGKTTLAQFIFNDVRVVNHFELRIWVCVSEDFNLKRMSKTIIESANIDVRAEMDLEPLQKKLQELLQRKRYLLVLDDVWNEDQEKWDKLKSVLACGAKGASILVTTRLQNVASIMGTIGHPHKLSMLSENDCWELFKQRAFGQKEGEQAEHANLVVIGKEIVKKCKGVPLAAKALGGLLRFKREEKEWLNVKESKIWNLPQDEKMIMPALRLSYLNLPVKLRQCFAYCALFPKDERICKELLIRLWMTNGFISCNGILEAEDVGDKVWNELYWRSLFQDIETDVFGKIRSFKMHDLVHDLAQSVTEEVHCITKYNGFTSLSERIRHLYVLRPNSIQLHKVKSLKTCIMPQYCVDPPLPQLLKCYSLRVLDMMQLEKLSSSIGHLKLLRYLNLSYGLFETLPDSLCRLWNLQILKLDYCDRLQKLPNRLNHLKALQHLSFANCPLLSSMPPKIGQLISLKTLSAFIVGEKRGFHLSELGRLNLKGELHIKHLERVRSATDAKKANMASKHLNVLRLSWDGDEESHLQENVEQILEVLQPNTQQLQTLIVDEYTGVRFPQWMCSPFQYLDSVKLVNCKSCLRLPLLGKLPSLKRLEMYDLIHVNYLDDESYNSGITGCFIALEFLLMDNLPNLIRLSRIDRENMFQRLSVLLITNCPKLLDLPCLPSLKELEISGKCHQDLPSSIHNFRGLESLKCWVMKS